MTGPQLTRKCILVGAFIIVSAIGSMALGQTINSGGLEPAAAVGDTSAQRKLGEALVFGSEEVKQDVARGIKLLDEAAAAGDLQAKASLGKILLDGTYVAAQPERAARLLEQAADAGSPLAQLTLGKALLWGLNLKADPLRAKVLLQDAAHTGDNEAKRVLGEQLVGGWVLKRDAAAGLKLLEQAVDAGDDKAMVSLGGLLLYGTGVKQNLPRARVLFEKAAKAGNGEGLENYGAYLMWSRKKPAQAERYLRRAGEMGRSSAWSTLAEGAMYGYLGRRSRAKFNGYAKKARAGGVDEVAVFEAERQMWGISMRASGPKTIERLEKAADDGNKVAASYLIALVRDGNHYNVRKRPKQARAYLVHYASLLGYEKTAQLTMTINAASTRQVGAYPKLKAVYDEHPEWRSIWFGKQLYAANENLTIYILQSQMKSDGLYAGRINGYATRATLRAMWRACLKLPDTKRCSDSVMNSDVVAALLAR